MNHSFQILLIEDDEDDIKLMEEALMNNNISYNMNVIMEGDKVLTYLKTCSRHPHVIVMDFNLLKLHGKEILKQIKFSKFNVIPLIVLTTSTTKTDIEYSLEWGANFFLTKPTTTKGFDATVARVVECATLGKSLHSFKQIF